MRGERMAPAQVWLITLSVPHSSLHPPKCLRSTLPIRCPKGSTHVISGVSQPHTYASPQPPQARTHKKMMWKWKRHTPSRIQEGHQGPLLFLLSHRTFGGRSEEMCKWNEESEGTQETVETSPPEEGSDMTPGLWTGSPWAPSCSVPHP